MIFVLLPMCLFIFSAYKYEAIQINPTTLLCETDGTWKMIFISINLIYFILLAFLLCFIPNFIKDQYFNEGLGLRDSILFTTIIFLIEIWIGFRENFVTFTWIMISNFMVFCIPSFVIARLFWYKLFQALRKNLDYESEFIRNNNERKHDNKYYLKVVMDCNIDNKLTMGFLDYTIKRFGSEEIELINAIDSSIHSNVSIQILAMFIRQSLQLQKDLCLKSNNDIDEVSKIINKKANFELYQTILDVYIISEKIPLTPQELSQLTEININKLSQYTLRRITIHVLKTLYSRFFRFFAKSEEICQISEESRKNVEIKTSMNIMFSINDEEYEDTSFDSIELLESDFK
jgi:hypothetical protein